MIIVAACLALRSDPETGSAGGISSPPQQGTATLPTTSGRSSEQFVPEIAEVRIFRGQSVSTDRSISSTSNPTQSSSDTVAGIFTDRKALRSNRPLSSIESRPSVESVPKVNTATWEHFTGDASAPVPYIQPAPQPAVMVDFDDPAVSLPDAKERLEAIASDFSGNLTRSGMDVASPAYRQLWDREAAVADARFRSMYGGHVWMNHHIQSHHAQLGYTEP